MVSDLLYHWCVITAIVVPVILILLLFLLRAERRRRKEGSEKAKRVAIALLITIIVISAVTVVLVIYIDKNSARYEYTATVFSDQSGVVHLPIMMDKDLQDQLEVRSGEGSISIVDTEHGRALRIEFSGDVKVNGRTVRDDRLDDGGLTMLEGEHGNEAWVNLELDGAQDGHVAITVNLENTNVPGHDADFRVNDSLEVGWNLYLVGGGEE
jgi:hypothetical protein